jgi:hypothetical protein
VVNSPHKENPVWITSKIISKKYPYEIADELEKIPSVESEKITSLRLISTYVEFH